MTAVTKALHTPNSMRMGVQRGPEEGGALLALLSSDGRLPDIVSPYLCCRPWRCSRQAVLVKLPVLDKVDVGIASSKSDPDKQ